MKRVYIVGRVRGFFSHLIKEENSNITFLGDAGTYEVSSKIKTIMANLLRTKLVGFFGIYKVVKVKTENNDIDYCLSFNRFLKSDKPYFIYLENPTALCNYSLTCLNSPFVKARLKKSLADRNLKKIICMSKACEKTIQNVLGIPVPKDKLIQIYPYVPANPFAKEAIYERCNKEKFSILYIAQGSRFISKGGMEVIYSFRKLRKKYNIGLTIISNIDQINKRTLELIQKQKIDLYDFKFSYKELEHIYSEHSILVQPSSDDSCSMTVLEAMKAGLPIIASDMYAFKEMVKNEENGYLISPSYRFFDKNDLPNPKVWNHRKQTIYSGKLNYELIDNLCEKIEILNNDRKLLMKMSENSLDRAETIFGKERLLDLWNKIIDD